MACFFFLSFSKYLPDVCGNYGEFTHTDVIKAILPLVKVGCIMVMAGRRLGNRASGTVCYRPNVFFFFFLSFFLWLMAAFSPLQWMLMIMCKSYNERVTWAECNMAAGRLAADCPALMQHVYVIQKLSQQTHERKQGWKCRRDEHWAWTACWRPSRSNSVIWPGHHFALAKTRRNRELFFFLKQSLFQLWKRAIVVATANWIKIVIQYYKSFYQSKSYNPINNG